MLFCSYKYIFGFCITWHSFRSPFFLRRSPQPSIIFVLNLALLFYIYVFGGISLLFVKKTRQASPRYGQSHGKYDNNLHSIETYTVQEDTSLSERDQVMNTPLFVSEEEIFTSSSLKEKPGQHIVRGVSKIEHKIPIGDDTNSSDSEKSESSEPSLPEVRFAQTMTPSIVVAKRKVQTTIPKALPNYTRPQQLEEPNQPKPTEASKNSKDKSKPPEYMDDIPAETSSEGLDPESLMFRDGKRAIDLVLVFDEDEDGSVSEIEAKKQERRRNFHQNLLKEGLELELEHKSLSFDGKTWFLKIHIPLYTQKRIADVVGIHQPVKQLISISEKSRVGTRQAKINERQAKRDEEQAKREERQAMRELNKVHRDNRQAMRHKNRAELDAKQAKFEKKQAKRDEKQAKFDAKQAIRDQKKAKRDEKQAELDEIESKLIAAKLAREQEMRDDKLNRGEKEPAMLNDDSWYTKMYKKWTNRWRLLLESELSFYAAHQDGVKRVEQFLVKDRDTEFSGAQRSYMAMQILLRAHYDKTQMGIRRLLSNGTYRACFPLHDGRYDRDRLDGSRCERRLLYVKWARPTNWYKTQPLWLIRRYFGAKIGLYFCWLGFYTWMLVLPSVVGTLCFFYGLLTVESSPYAVPSIEICNTTGPGNITLCPLCDQACRYQKLSDSCVFGKLSYIFDNPATVFFAIFMSFWATAFLELWKRREMVLRWEWDLYGIDDYEGPRPEFEESVKTFIINPVTQAKEPHMTTLEKSLRYVATSSVILFMLAVVIGAVLGTIIYRISMVLVIYRHKGTGEMIKKHARILNAIAAALLNLIVIFMLCKVYRKIAARLVNMENPRTQTEYNDSFAFKIFIFECVNYYSSLIYIAFFKGLFYDHPGDKEARQSEFLKLKGDICDPAGCLSELCIHLAIIMVGKQFASNFIDLIIPWCHSCWRQTAYRYITLDLNKPFMAWERDYTLPSPKRMVIFNDTLKLIIQYGFVTLFVAAFPLAPLFALINNIIEIRLEAFRLLVTARRPFTERVDDLGAWYNILKGITYLAVVSNAFVIGYTSDFIPCMVYKYVYSPDFTLAGYINHSLSSFNTSDYRHDWGADTEVDPPFCAYIGYRNPPDHPKPYGLAAPYWHVFAARLAFVVIFEHIIFGLTGLMEVIIPDVPRTLALQLQREAMIAKEERFDDKGRYMVKEYNKMVMERTAQSKERRKARKVRSALEVESQDVPVHRLNTMYY